MGEAIIAALASTAFTVGSTSVTYGGLLTAAALGTSVAASTMSAPDVGGSTTVNKVDGIADKTTPQQADQLDAAALGDDESEKLKRKSAKAKFKIAKDKTDSTGSPAEAGVKLSNTENKVTGVQL